MHQHTTVHILDDLITEAKNGDVNSFKKIVIEHQSYAYAVAFRFLCDEDDAEDVVQESFIRIWNHLRDFNPSMKFTTWMYKIVVNLCVDKAKSNKRRGRIFSRLNEDSFNGESFGQTDIERELTDKEMAGLIKSVADGLSEKQQMIFLLRDVQDLSIHEVAEITGMSESGIKTNLFYARQNIKKKLARLEVRV